jgi:hypothetical protein
MPAVRFHTQPLSDADANRLHCELGDVVHVHDVWLAGDEGAAWVGAIAPVDSTEAALRTLIERLRADARIQAPTVAVGNFP